VVSLHPNYCLIHHVHVLSTCKTQGTVASVSVSDFRLLLLNLSPQSVSYYRCMLEYKANVPPKCAIVEAITDLPDLHRELLKDAPRWQK